MTYGPGEWMMRNGGKAVVTHKEGHGVWCFVGNVEGIACSWTITGRYFQNNESPLDLIKRWEDPTPAAPADEIAALKAENERLRKIISRAEEWYWPEGDTSSDACGTSPHETLVDYAELPEGEIGHYATGGIIRTGWYGFLGEYDDDDFFEIDEPTKEAARAKMDAEIARRTGSKAMTHYSVSDEELRSEMTLLGKPRLREIDREIVTLREELTAAMTEIERMKNELGDPRGEIDHAKSITSVLESEIATLKAENERLRVEHAEWFAAAYGGDFDGVVSGIATEARNKALDEASSHLRTKANEMRGDSPSNIADTIARIFEEQADAIETMKGGDT